jgi:DNA replication protein DnaC
VSITRELVFGAGVLCYVINWRDLLNAIAAGFEERETTSTRQRLSDLFNVPVLTLDDIGAEQATDWRRDQLATLIEERYGRQLPMLVTSNYSLPELGRRLGHDDPVVGQRLVSRLRENAMGVEIGGADRRLTAFA